MKRILITLYMAWFVTLLPLLSQPCFTANTEKQNLGQIAWKVPASIAYTITNTGDEPLVVTEVESECACTVADWTKVPIKPGEKGIINVRFDAETLGHFQKSVSVYTNAQPYLTYLYFNGEVVWKVKDFTQSHPYQIGEIRIDKKKLEFSDVSSGEESVLYIDLVNLSEDSYEPILMHLPPYLQMSATPAVLQKGERGVIKLSLDSKGLTDLGLTQTSVYLSRHKGDTISEENEIPVSAILLPDFSALSDWEKSHAPQLRLSETEINLRAMSTKQSKSYRDITLTNIGKSPLQISKLQVFHPLMGVSLKKSLLQPGESTRLRVTLAKKEFDQKQDFRLLMITNDPSQPKIEINIKN